MYVAEGDVQYVLRCGQCNKPFDKQSTLKRHGYYCRSRRAASTARPRSCVSCAKGKTRCDHKRPECSRCMTKAIECHYPANTIKDTRPRTQKSDDAPTEWRRKEPLLVADSPSVKSHHEASNDGEKFLDSALVISDPEFANLGEGYLGWDGADINFADFLDSQMSDQSVQYALSGSSHVLRHSTPSTVQYPSLGSSDSIRSSTPLSDQIQEAVSPPNISIPPVPTNTVRSLIQRPRMKTGEQRTANIILHILKSYPLMMLLHNTLPPFIHPRSISPNAEHNDMEPLTNCISLLHMISSGVQGNRKLFWKNVRLECERLYEENLKSNKWELLAAMQALSIYILIRLSEGQTDHNNFDFLLLATVTILARQLASVKVTHGTQSALYNNYDVETSWKDWIFEESRRRVCVIYQVVNMLVYFEPAAMCNLQPDLLLAPLPAKRQLWEAGDAFSWKAERKRELGVRSAFGLATNGELVSVDESQLYCGDAVLRHPSLDDSAPSRITANWEEWCAGMDGFGGLIMLTASLIV